MSAISDLVGNMTVAQLAELAGVSIDDVVGRVLGKRGASAAAKAEAPKKAARGGRKAAKATAPAATKQSGSHNTRTKAGRDALDAAILDFLKAQGEPVRALDIRRGIGGTPAQIRTRLNTLIERGKVGYTGKASGTRYRAK